MIAFYEMKNDAERLAFLDDYRNAENGWYLWKADQERQVRLYRYDVEDLEAKEGVSFIVEEELRTVLWPNKHLSWTVRHWYIITESGKKDWTFADQVASRTQVLNKIKDIQRRAKK